MHIIEKLTWLAILALSTLLAYFGDYDSAIGVIVIGLMCRGIVMVDERMKGR